jgi:hypothetical protein
VSDFIIIWPVYVLRKSFQLIVRIFNMDESGISTVPSRVRRGRNGLDRARISLVGGG